MNQTLPPEQSRTDEVFAFNAKVIAGSRRWKGADRAGQDRAPPGGCRLGEILEGVGTDYQFRARVPVEDLAEAMQGIVREIDYPNFKNAVTRNQGPKRARIYHEVWQTLWQINQED